MQIAAAYESNPLSREGYVNPCLTTTKTTAETEKKAKV